MLLDIVFTTLLEQPSSVASLVNECTSYRHSLVTTVPNLIPPAP